MSSSGKFSFFGAGMVVTSAIWTTTWFVFGPPSPSPVTTDARIADVARQVGDIFNDDYAGVKIYRSGKVMIVGGLVLTIGTVSARA